MNRALLALLAVLIAFGALTAVALIEHGLVGIFRLHLTSSAGLQVFVDLVIVCVLAMVWMIHDARRNGRTVWPFLVLTVSAGAFGPLFYLLVGQWRRTRQVQLG